MTDTDAHEQRIYLAGEALNAYCNARGTINAPDEDITDLITDLLHLLDTYEGQASVGLVLAMVKSHYEAENGTD
jgi:hypothetical protein